MLMRINVSVISGPVDLKDGRNSGFFSLPTHSSCPCMLARSQTPPSATNPPVSHYAGAWHTRDLYTAIIWLSLTVFEI